MHSFFIQNSLDYEELLTNLDGKGKAKIYAHGSLQLVPDSNKTFCPHSNFLSNRNFFNIYLINLWPLNF